jgi:hypothetical protein
MLCFGLLAEMMVHRRLSDDRPLAAVAERSERPTEMTLVAS